jgi:GR25 family glycosyltransferase involved in LPS biosynthesis
MTAIVINLDHRQDRLQAFRKNNDQKIQDARRFSAVNGAELNYEKLKELDFDTDKNWRDPILNRNLTWGEIGCFISHYRIWETVANETSPVLILEDDVILHESSEKLLAKIGDRDLLYITHKEMMKNGAVNFSEGQVIPCYPYWAAAYILTPAGAKTLISTDIRHNIIPVDEYLPRMLDRIKVAACAPSLASQVSRDEMGTNIEPNSESDYVIDFKTHVLTCGDDETRMEMLLKSAKEQDIEVTNVLKHQWSGGTMEGPGGGQKLNEIVSYLEDNNVPDHDVVLFTDAFDVFYVRNLSAVLGRFLGFKTEVLFSAESQLWPDNSLVFPPTHTKYRYLNSGTFIGRVGELKRMLSEPIEDGDDDQLYLQKAYLSGKFKVKLDVEGYIFQTHEEAVTIKQGSVFNPLTECFCCIYHGNGGSEAKAHLNALYQKLWPDLKYAEVKDYKVIGNEMILIDCFTKEDCQRWIDISEKHGGWNPHPDDRFPSHDIHLKELGLWDEWEDHWRRVIAPITDRYWRPSAHHHLRKAFTMKYSADTQKTLGLHTDAALVTGSMKLNDDYEGATLIFPRQGVTNKDIPVGKLILFPGPLTHGHFVDPLVSGTKYSFTTWTARYQGDLLNP